MRGAIRGVQTSLFLFGTNVKPYRLQLRSAAQAVTHMDSNTLIDRTRHCTHFLFHRIVVKVNTLITWLHLISSCALWALVLTH